MSDVLLFCFKVFSAKIVVELSSGATGINCRDGSCSTAMKAHTQSFFSIMPSEQGD